MDSDMQDDPAGIPMLVDKWREGYDVVYALRVQRKENLVKRMLFSGFYQVLSRLSYVPLPRDAGNFSLVDGKVARGIAGLAEYDRYFPGIRGWIGFQQVGVEIGRLPRYDGKGRVSYRGLYNLAKTAIFSFSSFPLSVFYYITYASLLICGVVIVFTLYHKFVTGLAIPGWTSYVLITSFFGAINSLGIGILGEYIMRIYDQVRGRPNFVIDRKINL